MPQHFSIFISAVTSLAICSACAIPGSMGAKYNLRGELLDKTSGKPISNQFVTVMLPGAVGVSATEVLWSDHETQSNKLKTKADGTFDISFDHIIHASFFIIPPLGMRPKQAPPPFFIIQSESDKCRMIWAAKYYEDKGLEYRIPTPDGEFEEVVHNGSPDLTGKMSYNSSADKTVDAEVKILWDEKTACETQERVRKIKPTKTVVFASYNDLFKDGVGFGLSRKVYKEAVRIDLPVSIEENSNAVALVAKLRWIPISRGALGLGFGAISYSHVPIEKPLPSGSLEASGIASIVYVSYDISFRNHMYAEIGHRSYRYSGTLYNDGWFGRLGYLF